MNGKMTAEKMDEVRREAYLINDYDYAYDGFSAEQWIAMAEEGRQPQGYEIAEILRKLTQ